MHMRVFVFVAMLALLSAVATAQPVAGAPPDAFQVQYAINLNTVVYDDAVGPAPALRPPATVINLLNAGSSAVTGPPAVSGDICVNVYIFDASNEELESCCACRLTPNQNAVIFETDLLKNFLTPATPAKGLTIKLIATQPTSSGKAGCNAASPTATNLTTGLRAWITHAHNAWLAGTTTANSTFTGSSNGYPAAYYVTESAFEPGVLSMPELTKVTGYCAFVENPQFGSTYGICPGCKAGALGGTKK